MSLRAELFCLAVLLMLGAPRISGREDLPVAEIKSAFFVNIARFVEWPSDSPRGQARELVFCPWMEATEAIQPEVMNGRRIGYRRLRVRPLATLETLAACHVLFIPVARFWQFDRQVPAQRRQDLLVVTDLTVEEQELWPPPSGVLIALFRQGTRIGIAIDLEAAQAANLRISSELLKLARLVAR